MHITNDISKHSQRTIDRVTAQLAKEGMTQVGGLVLEDTGAREGLLQGIFRHGGGGDLEIMGTLQFSGECDAGPCQIWMEVADSGDVLAVYFQAVWTADLPATSAWWNRGWGCEEGTDADTFARLERNPNLAKSIKRFLRKKYYSVTDSRIKIGEEPWLTLEADGNSHCTLTIRTTVRNGIVIPGIPPIMHPVFTWGHRFDIKTFDYIYSALLNTTNGRKLSMDAWPEPHYDEDTESGAAA